MCINDYQLKKVCDFLHKLTRSTNYTINTLRETFANKVIKIIELLAADDENIRNEVLSMCIDGDESCQDRAVLTISSIDLLLMRIKAEKLLLADKQCAEFITYMKAKLITAKIEEYALKHAQNNQVYEEVEFALAYLIKLAPRFNLPFDITSANYTGMAKLQDKDIEDAFDTISAKITDAFVDEQLKQEPVWQKYQCYIGPKWKDYNDLPVKDLPIDPNQVELFTQEKVTEIGDLVYYDNTPHSYKKLHAWYFEFGTHPILTDSSIDPNKIYIRRPSS